ncbi:MAG: hypothetical protein ABSH06_23545, partial [Thermodesulfobacteriota bacterium]
MNLKKLAMLAIIACPVTILVILLFPSYQAHAVLPEPHYEALNSRGFMPDVQLISLAQRPSDLNNKVVYIINSW